MYRKDSTAELRAQVVRLAAVTFAVLVVGVAALCAYAWRAVDASQARREEMLVTRTLTHWGERILRETASAAEWDEAFVRTGARDVAWIDDYFAGYYRNAFGHDVTLLLDGDGRLIYGAKGGERISQADGELTGLAAAALPLARALQSEEVGLRASRAGGADAEVSFLAARSAVLRSSHGIYLVAVSTVLPSHGLPSGRKPALAVVSGRRIDGRFLADLERQAGVAGAFLAAPDGRGVQAALRDPQGVRTGTISWRTARPGRQALADAAGPVLLVVLVLGVFGGLLAAQIRELLSALGAKDRALHQTLGALEAARDEAEAASRAKSRFIANVSHEIRTPLNGVLGMAQAMAADALPSRQRERLDVLRASGETLLAMLNDVLDLSKIEAGKLDVEMVDFDLADLVKGAHAAFTAVAERSGLDFTLQVAPEALGRFRSDPTRLRQILYNLISNALKFTRQGGVKVQVLKDGGRHVFQVSDTGVGMSAATVERLFQAFEQADASTTRQFGGSGLGLAISRELAQRLGGDLLVESREGEGAVFRLVLQLEPALAAAPADAAQDPSPPALDRPLRVLAAEDNPINQLVLKTLLAPFDLELTVVPDGALAVEAWASASWDVILMDVQMPVLDGLEATRRIREEEQRSGRAPTPIIALTANAMAHQREEYRAIGMDGLAAKPVDVAHLVAEIGRVIQSAVALDAPGPHGAEDRTPAA